MRQTKNISIRACSLDMKHGRRVIAKIGLQSAEKCHMACPRLWRLEPTICEMPPRARARISIT